MYNILVTGVGAIIGYGIVESLKKSSIKTNVTGMDIYDDAYGRFNCDHFIKSERADSPKYIEFINNVITDHNIDLIITGIEQDLYSIWTGKEFIKTKVVLNNDLCIQLSKNKFETFRYLSQFDINLIPTLSRCSYSDCVTELGLPFLFKPILSYASKGIEVIKTEREFEFYTAKHKNNCIYQKIVGTEESEYTVAVFGDGEGGFFDNIILNRKLSGEGATRLATLAYDDDIIEYVKQLCMILKPEGPTNIQVRKEADKVLLLEINPRISSACSIRTLMGYNEPEMCLKYFLRGEKIVETPKREGKVIRYISDYFLPK